MTPFLLAAFAGCGSLEASKVPELGPGAVTVIYQSRGEGEIEPCG